MKLDGRTIAETIYTHLRKRVRELQKKTVVPHLVVILVGENPASIAYILQKRLSGENIGGKVTVLKYPPNTTEQELEEKIKLLNSDPFVHGILIQRPLPKHIDSNTLSLITAPEKDVDGFHPDSQFTLPLPLAVEKLLEEIYLQKQTKTNNFLSWLQSQDIVLLGKGEAGGKPIFAYLTKLHVSPQIIDSKTPNAKELLKQADIVISAVGKKVIKPEMLKKGVILIGVGLFKDENGKLQGDYDEETIKDITAFYTPTPGGVGPVNVAMLMDNLITATEKQTA